MSSRYRQPDYPVHSRTMTPRQIPDTTSAGKTLPSAAWQSRDFLAALYLEGGHRRLTISRTDLDRRTGTWRDGITWDELQAVKAQCGFGDTWAVEIFPPDDEVVDVAEMRHLWLLNEAPACAWRRIDRTDRTETR